MLNKELFSSVIKDMDSKGRITVAANAFGNVDSQNDVSLHGSFQKTLKENFARLKWFLNHDRTQLLGVPLEGSETSEYLQLTGQLNMNKDIGRDAYSDYELYAQYGKSLEHSIGVDPIKYTDDQGIRKVSEWKLWEYSTLTSWGSNSNTPMLAIKNAGGSIIGAIDWLDLKLRKGNYTDETFEQIEDTLTFLKSLTAEPDNSTQKAQPILMSDLTDVSTLFLKSLQN